MYIGTRMMQELGELSFLTFSFVSGEGVFQLPASVSV